MLQLAYNLKGEPFEAPATMAAWRVYKMKKAGAPDIVYGLDGLPLFLPMDSDTEDLRYQVRGETGKFRLEPVDEHNKSIANAPAGYVCVHPLAPAPAAPVAPAVPAASASNETTSLLVAALLDSQKQHTEMARMYVSQFAVVTNAIAGVVRSAGDAGLTTRVPLVLPTLPEAKPDEGKTQGSDDGDEDEDEDEDEDDDQGEDETDQVEVVEVAPTSAYSWARVGQTLAEQVSPYIPGLAKLLGVHGGKLKTDATPGPGPSDPAPARVDASAPSGPVPGLDAAMLVRLQQIMAQLTPEEDQFARSLFDEISREDMASWIGRLRAMSVPEAVGYVRDMFRQARAAAGDTEPVRASAPTAPTAPTAPRRAGHPARGSDSSESSTARRPQGDASPIRRPMPTMPANDGPALRDADTQAHLDRIERALSADERTAMRKHFAALSPSERSLFVATLLMLPVADAVAVVRGQVGAHRATSAPASPARGDAPATQVTIAPDEASNRTASTPAGKRPRATAANPARHDVMAPAPAEPATRATEGAPTSSAAPTAAPADAPATVERNASAHLAEIESTLSPEERLVVHTVISALSPQDRDVWLDRLLSASIADGAAMLRAAVEAATAEPATGQATTTSDRHQSATASTAHAAVTSDEPDAEDQLDDGDQPDDDDELGDGDELDDGDEPYDDDEPYGDDELGGDNELDGGNGLDGGNEPAVHEEPATSAASQNRPEAPRPQATAPTPTIAIGAELPTLDGDSLAHFQAIEDALTLAEKMRANELAAKRPASELRRWYAELVALSVPEAVAKIRAELARSDGDSLSTDSHSPTKGGVS